MFVQDGYAYSNATTTQQYVNTPTTQIAYLLLTAICLSLAGDRRPPGKDDSACRLNPPGKRERKCVVMYCNVL